MQKHTIEEMSQEDILEEMEYLLDEIGYFTNLDSECEIKEEIDNLVECLKGDVNLFLEEIFTDSDDDHYRGAVISELLRLHISIDKIKYSIIKDCIDKSVIMELVQNGDDWECLKELASYDSLDLEYLHFNNYELYIDIDNFGEDISELILVLNSLKKLGYVYVIVTKNENLCDELKNSVHGVVVIK